MSQLRPVSSAETDAALRLALDGLARRQQVIASNVANVDTPHFKASEVHFEAELAAALQRREAGLALQRTNQAHLMAGAADLAQLQPTTREMTNLSYRNDGNNVDIDAQMSALAETQLRYAAVTQAASSRLGQLRTIISEGRR